MATKTKTPDTAAALDAAAEQLDQAEQTQQSAAERVEALRQAVIDGDTTVSAADIATTEAAANHAALLAEAARRRLAEAEQQHRQQRARTAAEELAAEIRADLTVKAPSGRQAAEALRDAMAAFVRDSIAHAERVQSQNRRALAIAADLAEADGKTERERHQYRDVAGLPELLDQAEANGPRLIDHYTRKAITTEEGMSQVLGSMLVDIFGQGHHSKAATGAVSEASSYRFATGGGSALERFLRVS